MGLVESLWPIGVEGPWIKKERERVCMLERDRVFLINGYVCLSLCVCIWVIVAMSGGVILICLVKAMAELPAL